MIYGFEVEIVPSYKISDASKKMSSVDRSVFHQRYLKKRLSEKQKNEISFDSGSNWFQTP